MPRAQCTSTAGWSGSRTSASPGAARSSRSSWARGCCDAAFALAEDADLLVCESTFLAEDADLARRYGHLTASQAATIAREVGARRLVLTHFSQRYKHAEHRYLAEARAIFPEVVVASDLQRVAVPPRSPGAARARDR